jgi:predicted nucleic acid-binding protein
VIYTLDTNIVVDALRRPDDLDRLKAFLSWALPATVLSSVVAAELTAGARTPKALGLLDQAFLAPFERRGRILAPSDTAWRRAAQVVGTASGTAFNDALLACQAREYGWTIITRDADFGTLRRSISGLKVAVPFPTRP